MYVFAKFYKRYSIVFALVLIVSYLGYKQSDYYAVTKGCEILFLHQETQIVKEMLEKRPHLLNCKYGGSTLLYAAVVSGNLDMVNFILKKGHGSDDKLAWNFLIMSSLNNDYEMTKLLLKEGFPLEPERPDKLTPFEAICMDAADSGDFKFVDLFLRYGVDINKQKWKKVLFDELPIIIALLSEKSICYEPYAQKLVIHLLDNCEVDMNVNSPYGFYLYYGILSGSEEIVEKMLECGADPSLKFDDSKTILEVVDDAMSDKTVVADSALLNSYSKIRKILEVALLQYEK